jgi:hypothetical protein
MTAEQYLADQLERLMGIRRSEPGDEGSMSCRAPAAPVR